MQIKTYDALSGFLQKDSSGPLAGPRLSFFAMNDDNEGK